MATRKNRRNCKSKTRKTTGGGWFSGWFSSTPTSDGTNAVQSGETKPSFLESLFGKKSKPEPTPPSTTLTNNPLTEPAASNPAASSNPDAPSNPTGVQLGGRRRKSRSRSTRRRRAFGK